MKQHRRKRPWFNLRPKAALERKIVMKSSLISFAIIGFCFCGTAQATDYSAVLTAPPQSVPTYTMSDGPLLGNGDVGVVLAGPPEEQRFYIGKNDWWGYGDGSGAMPAGGLTLAIAELKGASYRQEQDLALAEVRGSFTKGEVVVQTRSFVDANSNLLVTELKCAGHKPATAIFSQKNGLEEPWGTRRTSLPAGVLCYTRVTGDAPPEKRRDIAVVSRLIGGAPVVDDAGGTLKATLNAGEIVTIVSSVLTKRDDPDFLEAAKKKVLALEAKDIPAMTAKHREWWKSFWAKSFIEIPDKEIEKRWYAALYVMGSCSKAGKVAYRFVGMLDHDIRAVAWRFPFELQLSGAVLHCLFQQPRRFVGSVLSGDP